MSRQSQPQHAGEEQTSTATEPAVSRPLSQERGNSSHNDQYDCDEDWDGDYDYQDYGDDYCLNNQKSSGGNGGAAGCKQKTTKRQNQRGGGGRNNVYSSKHVRVQAAMKK
jgi:hypothetical protein